MKDEDGLITEIRQKGAELKAALDKVEADSLSAAGFEVFLVAYAASVARIGYA